MSSLNTAGISMQFLKVNTPMDTVIASSKQVDFFRAQGGVHTQPLAIDWVAYPLTTPTKGLDQFTTTECAQVLLSDIGCKIGRMYIRITAPPICNTLTNTEYDGTTLSSISTAVAALTIGTGTLGGSGSFAANDVVTLSGGSGSDFSGTVTAVTSGRPTAVTIDESGSGYATGVNYTMTNTAGRTLAGVQIATLGRKLTRFPAVGGRVLLPHAESGGNAYSGGISEESTNTGTVAHCNRFKNCIMSETTAVTLKTVTGVTMTDTQMDMKRTGGFAAEDMAAYYCRAAPLYLIDSVIMRCGLTNDTFNLTSDAIQQYHMYWASAYNSVPPEDTFLCADQSDLKFLSMRGDVVWNVPLPFPFCHARHMALTKLPIYYGVNVTFKNWASIIVNSPTYNPLLSVTLRASAVTTTVSSGTGFPAATYTPTLQTVTVSGGRIGTGRASMLSAIDDASVVVPATPLLNTMFQAQLLVEHIRLSTTEEAVVRSTPYTQIVCLHKLLGTPDRIQSITNYEGYGTKEIGATLPTAAFLVQSQRLSRPLLNLRADFTAPRDALTYSRPARSSANTPFHGFFQSIELKLDDVRRMLLTGDMQAISAAAAGVSTHAPGVRGTGTMILPLTAVNPYECTPAGYLSSTSIGTVALSYNVNPAVLNDYQYVGGLPAEGFMASVYALVYSQLVVNPAQASVSVRYTS